MKFKPESKANLADRLPDALIDNHELRGSWTYPKCESRDNVFDFQDNMRLEIARVENEFHVVATPTGGSVFLAGIKDEDIVKSVIERTKEIGLLDIIGKSDITAVMGQNGVLHLILREGDGRINLKRQPAATMTTGTESTNE